LTRPYSANSVLEDIAALELSAKGAVDGLPDEVSAATRAHLAKAGITSLSPVQRLALPPALKGLDVLARGKTGTGKTLGFLMPTIERLAAKKRLDEGAVRAVIIAHTRELATQIFTECAALCALHGLSAQCLMGGKSVAFDLQHILCGVVDVLVCTPGRLAEHHASTPGFADRLAGVEIAVLDEADELFDGGFAQVVRQILGGANPDSRQTLCFSATLPEPLLKHLATVMRPDRVFVDASPPAAEVAVEDAAPPRVSESLAFLPSDAACLRAVLHYVADEMAANASGYKVVIFFATAKFTQFAAACLRGPLESAAGGAVSLLEIHSKLPQNKRDRAADDFRAAETAVLCTSDVSARGVDYPDVSLVVQCEAPSSREAYVHRLGRTGRAGKAGRGVLLLHGFEKSFVAELAQAKEGVGGAVKDVSKDLAAVFASDPPLFTTLGAAASNVDDALATAARDAFVSHFTQRKKLTCLSKAQLVLQADAFAVGVLGRSKPPPFGEGFAKSLGLVGVAGVETVAGEEEHAGGKDKEAKDAETKAARLAEKANAAAAIRAEKIAAGQRAKAAAAASRGDA